MSDWQPIETAQSDTGEIILAYWPSDGTIETISTDGLDYFESVGNMPTHWMPLPKPPGVA